MKRVTVLALLAAVSHFGAYAQGLPPVPQGLARTSAVSCIRIDDAGAVSGAFLVVSTGKKSRDRKLVEWIKQLRWPPAGPDETSRNTWFPMPIAFGERMPPDPPPSCAPKSGS